MEVVGPVGFEPTTYGLRDAAPGLGMAFLIIPISTKSSTYANSTEFDRRCPNPCEGPIAINCAIKMAPRSSAILVLDVARRRPGDD